MAAVRGQLLKLRNEELRLQQGILRHKASIAPIRKLPTEILSRILMFHGKNDSCEAKPYRHENAVLRNYHPMLVCKLWCKTAVNCPQLWTQHVLDERGAGCVYLDTRLKRAGSLPLDVLISLSTLPSWERPDVWALMRPVLHRLQRVQFRCGPKFEHLDVIVVPNKAKEIFMDLARSSITHLSIISVQFEYEGWESIFRDSPFPNLQYLTVTRLFSVPSINAPNLRGIIIADCSVRARSLCNTICSTENLEFLDIAGSDIEFGFDPDPSAAITNDLKLRQLRVGGDWSRDEAFGFYTSLFRQSFTIETLEIPFNGYIPRYVLDRPADAFDSLKNLTLKLHHAMRISFQADASYAANMRTTIEWFKALNRLEDLELQSTTFYDSDAGLILQSLIHSTADSKILLPRLSNLKVIGVSYWPSIFLRIMAERSASEDDLRTAEMDEQISIVDKTLTVKPFTIDLKLTINKPRTYGFSKSESEFEVHSGDWDSFHEAYKLHFGHEEQDSDTGTIDHFDLITFAGIGDAEERCRALCDTFEQFERGNEDEDDDGYHDEDSYDDDYEPTWGEVDYLDEEEMEEDEEEQEDPLFNPFWNAEL